jgi:hypothetical protein
MAHRTFIDAAGVEWQVWDVRPSWTWAERRRTDRRRGAGGLARDGRSQAPRERPDGAGVQERRLGDRRGEGTRQLVVRNGYEDGWLTFECAGQRRRLTPIPPGWDTLPDLTLAELCRRSVDVGVRPRLVE